MRSVKKLKNIVEEKISSEISQDLSYHGLHHTMSVYEVCNDYIKRMDIDPHDAFLLRTAALTHDIGILYTYNDHEAEGIRYVRKKLPELGYTPQEIDTVCDLIAATKLPQQPKNTLEEIICDADLDYIGTDKFYEVGDTLFQEFLHYGVVKDEEDWDKLQIRFLENHSYHTEFAQKHRAPVKEKYLQELKEKWGMN